MIRHLIYTEAGDGARGNEDAAAALVHPADERVLICALADGQGGRSGGARAARIAVERSLAAAARYSPSELENAAVWRAVGYAADRDVADDPDAGFTTLVTLAAREGLVIGTSSGDSGTLLVSGEGAVVLTEGQRKNPPVGSSVAELVPFRRTVTGPWKLLVMSDGVWKYVGWKALIQLASEQAGRALVDSLREEASRRMGGSLADDFTLVLAEGPRRTEGPNGRLI